MPSEHLSIEVDVELLAALREHAGPEGLGPLIDGALRHELARRRFRGYLAELEVELGPPDEAAVATELAEIRAAFGEA